MNTTRKFAFVLCVLLLFGYVKTLQAISGACSYHDGVDCNAGSDWDGSVICNDGWKDSSVSFSSMISCKQTNKWPSELSLYLEWMKNACYGADFNYLDYFYEKVGSYKRYKDVDGYTNLAKCLEEKNKIPKDYNSFSVTVGMCTDDVAYDSSQAQKRAYTETVQKCAEQIKTNVKPTNSLQELPIFQLQSNTTSSVEAPNLIFTTKPTPKKKLIAWNKGEDNIKRYEVILSPAFSLNPTKLIGKKGVRRTLRKNNDISYSTSTNQGRKFYLFIRSIGTGKDKSPFIYTEIQFD